MPGLHTISRVGILDTAGGKYIEFESHDKLLYYTVGKTILSGTLVYFIILYNIINIICIYY